MTSQSTHGEPDRDRFARIVKARRDALNKTQEEINELGGPSDTTFSKIENRVWQPGRQAMIILRKLDAGLQWEEGSAARTYFENGWPTPLPGTGGQTFPHANDNGAALREDNQGRFDLAVELSVLMEDISRAAWIALQSLPESEAAAVMDKIDTGLYLAEKLALQLAGDGDTFARARQQVRADARARTEIGTRTDTIASTPADLTEAVGQTVHANGDWESGPASGDSWDVARADAEREPDV